MDDFHGTASTHVRASADAVFALITDIDQLPDWNRAIRRVVERPAALVRDSEWVVVMRPPGMPPWKSRSHLQELVPGTRFVYRSHSDDRNPSYAIWQWDLTPTDTGTRIAVTWDGHPRTSFRRFVAAPLRSRMLEHEVAASLDSIRTQLEPSTASADQRERL